MAADNSYPNVVQIRQDGNMAVPTGKSVDIESGGAFKVAGTDVTTKLSAQVAASGGTQYATVAASGSSAADAAAITGDFQVVTAADGTKGVILPTPVAGRRVFLKNNAAAILKVYPNDTGTINALSADAAISMASLTSCVFCASSTTAWFTIPLLPS